MKIISLNANGIRAAERKGVYAWLDKIDADIICIQETKAQVDQLTSLSDSFFPEGYHCQYVDAQKKGYSGVAIYSKIKPQNIVTSLNYPLADDEGRFIQFDFDTFSVASLYLPSGTSGDERQAVKYDMMEVLEGHLKSLLEQDREFIFCGDWNIAHTKKDIKNWRGNQKNSGFLPEERAWLDKLFDEIGYVDAFRVVNQQEHQYTWWSNRGQAWANNTGWRIDYQITTPGLRDKIRSADIYKDERFSDHAPLIIDYQIGS